MMAAKRDRDSGRYAVGIGWYQIWSGISSEPVTGYRTAVAQVAF